MSKEIPDHVICKVTGVTHTVVCRNQNEEVFVEYLKDLLSRLNSGTQIFIAIDCKGWLLGIQKNSLGLIQMAECFFPKFMEETFKMKASIKLQPGFIIRTPIRPDIIDLMSEVFTHKFLSLIMFDLTFNVTSMMEIGLKFCMENIIDAQVKEIMKGEDSITNKKQINKLRDACMTASKCPEYEAAKEAINEKRDIYFYEVFCKTKDDGDKFSHMIDDKFWEESASDIALTALALAGRLKKANQKTIKKASNEKANAFLEIQRKFGLFAPALMREFSIIGRAFIKPPNFTKRHSYKLICQADIILNNYALYENFGTEERRLSKTEINAAVEKALAVIV